MLSLPKWTVTIYELEIAKASLQALKKIGVKYATYQGHSHALNAK